MQPIATARALNPAEPYARDELLHEIFAESAARWPDRCALRMATEDMEASRATSWTYATLRERAARFARYLRSRGVERGDRVVICLPRGLDQYMAILGVLEAGAAYAPVDWSFPQDRADFVAEDAEAKAVVTLGERSDAFARVPVRVAVDVELGEIAAMEAVPLTRADTGQTPDDLAYIIYTSGSTGRPKGVMIRHSNVCHLVRSESAILDLNLDDRVYGGFSLAFDMSVETMWSAFFVGAEVLAGSEALAKAGPDLAAVLAADGVTVWHAVPSLLAVIEDDVPSARLINLGGEACPPELARRWARPGRRLLNTYGPTETSVTATWTELAPDKPVTIGTPLPGYDCWVVDEALRPLPPGTEGELVIGGPGVGAGYVNRPELTAEKFVMSPFDGVSGRPELIYRSGDLVRVNAEGDIEFLGRIDTQVKIRGYRVELGEIESLLSEDAAVAQAVVQLFQDDGGDLLVAYVSPRAGANIDLERLRAHLRETLPAYMRPAHYEVLPSLPTLISGKVDRKALPKPVLAPAEARELEPPATPMEAKLLDAWNVVFTPQPVSVLDDFFEDLGGHSLRAAKMVSAARNDPTLRTISIQDLYAAPNIRALAERLELQAAAAAPEQAAPPFAPVPQWRRVLCVLGQTLALPFIFSFAGVQWIFPYLAYTWLVSNDVGRLAALALSGASFVSIPPLMILLSVAMKWVVIGKIKPGDYPMWGGYYFRWWLTRRLLSVMPTRFLSGTPLMRLYFRLLGAKVGQGVYLGSSDLDAPDLVSIGDGSILSEGCLLATTSVERGLFRVGEVRIGQRAFIGGQAVVGRGCRVGDGAVLEDLSALPAGETMPDGEVWTGAPAVRKGVAPPRVMPSRASLRRRVLVLIGLMVAAALLPLVTVLPVAPGLVAMIELDWNTDDYSYLLLAPGLALLYVTLMCLLTVAAKWLLLGRLKPGVYPLASWFYVRFWFVRQLGELALDLLHPIYATLYVAPWYRALGAKVGRRAEISTATSVVHDLVAIGPESFIADGVVFGGARVEPGVLRLESTRIGHRTFVGNSAFLPTGADLGDEVLIGVLSKPPECPAQALETGSTWFGAPPIRLPRRQSFAVFDEGARFNPSKRLVATRLAIEFVRLILSLTVFIGLFSIVLTIMGNLADAHLGAWWMTLAFPALYLGFCLAAGAFVVLLKWIVVGRYKPLTRPLWSLFVWRTELVTSTYENLAVPLLLEPLRGTPYLNLYLRLLGCKIGRRVYTDTTDITEHDLVEVGDDAALNDNAGLQTHLFEDRVMKVSTVVIGPRATIGSLAIVLYDSVVEADAQLGDLSVLMKGETLPAGTAWEGSPARPARGAL
ncbi:Pls/PosA family non-ribosomal peptide synthetase [Caulobacter sp. CCUG 60055]|nr:Pls/PosA family non-ribosomal peptide synthetase [Caulobacter sp. CCUG 60055]